MNILILSLVFLCIVLFYGHRRSKVVIKQNRIFTDEEKNTRNDWLRAEITAFLGISTIIFGNYIISLAFSENWESALESFMECLGVVLFLASSFAFMFYFAYVKCETKWMKLFVCTTPIIVVLEGASCVAELIKLHDLSITGFYFCLYQFVFLLTLYGFMWMHTNRLYELNLVIKRKRYKEKSELIPIKTV